MTRPLRLLTIGHSYVVAMNRRLADAIAAAGAGEWEVTAAAPRFFHADLRPMALEPIAGERCRVVPVPVRFSRRVHVMRYGRRLRELLREPWDVVHCWEEPFVLAAGQVARWAPRDAALVFATFQNLPKRYPLPFAWTERRAMRRADGWIAFGRTVEDALRGRHGYADRPHRVIPTGVDTGRFRPDAEARARVREELGWARDGPPVVGYLGRFVPEKGIGTLMRALDGCASPWRALFVGGGAMEGELRAWAAGHGDRVRIETEVKHDAVPGRLNAMDLLCAPSRTTPRWKEQLGRMLIEAMACGVPVAASDSGEIPHVVGGAGAVVPEADEDAWRRTLDHLLASPDARAELAAKGLARARDEFALPVVARRHLGFFAEVLAAKRAAATIG
jgi:glycosyltransferase involved in cell wall biosynthesis